MRSPVLAWTHTSQRPSGEILGNELLLPLADAPGTGWASPPRPSLKGTRQRSYLIWISLGSLALTEGGPAGTLSMALARTKMIERPSGVQAPLAWTYSGLSAPGRAAILPVVRS